MSTKDIVWLNGTFDVLHMGHIKLFEYARSLDGEVHVGVDTDERIRSMKGDGRPVNNLWNRVDFLNSIKYIDKVHIFGSDEELTMTIKDLSPKWMVIGNDYVGKKIIGREHIGQVIFLPRYQGLSSSAIINGAHN